MTVEGRRPTHVVIDESTDIVCPFCGSEDVQPNYVRVPDPHRDGLLRWVVGTYECRECPRREALERRAAAYADGVHVWGVAIDSVADSVRADIARAWLAGHAAAQENE